MFLVIPIGHSKTISRIPWVTAGILAVCLAVQVQSSFFAPDGRELARVARPLAVLTALERGDKIPAAFTKELPDDPAERARKKADLEAEFASLRRRDWALWLGHYFDEGLSPRLITSAFAHGGWLHLIGNMLFLYLCGCNLEDRWGRGPFLGFYLLGALVSSAFPMLLHHGDHVLSLGASGAIAACMGAFLVFYGAAEVKFFYFFWAITRPKVGTFEASAYWAGAVWFAVQVIDFFWEARGVQTGVGYSAHVSGFVLGAGAALIARRLGYDAKFQQAVEDPANWQEAPEVTEVLALVHDGRDHEALPRLLDLARTRPRDLGVHSELLSLGLKLNDASAVSQALPAILDDLVRRGEKRDALDRLGATLAGFPGLPLPDRTCASMARVAFELQDGGLGVQLTSRLMKQSAQSPLIPGAWMEVAKAQLKAGRSELARKTLEQIRTRFPLDPFAKQAEQLLAEIDAGQAKAG